MQQKRDGCNASCGEMDALFFELDQDDDGVVTEEEFSTWKEKLPVIREKKHQVLTNPCNEAMLDLLISTRVKRASQQSSVTSSTGGSDSRWPSVEATLLRDAHSKYRDRVTLTNPPTPNLIHPPPADSKCFKRKSLTERRASAPATVTNSDAGGRRREYISPPTPEAMGPV
eukprot:scaffold137_cov398-Prasinococcus_capsulatus_cf.AAC.29